MALGLATANLATAGCACAPMPSGDASLGDATVDARYCEPEREVRNGFVEGLGPYGSLNWIGETDATAGALPISYSDRWVTAAILRGPVLESVWDIRRPEDSGGSIRWEGTSLVGVLYRREQIDNPLLVQQYLLWRPQLSSTTTIELPIWDRWPYGGLGACGVSTEDVVPTPTRLWLVRSVQCSDDPEFGSEVRARLHAFAEDGSDVTPPEGIPLARVMWSQEVSSTFQAHADGGVSYLSMDRGSDGTEEEALHWVRRSPNGDVVARSLALATSAELEGSGNVWLRSDGNAALLYAHLPSLSSAIFARFEPDGEIAWSYRFDGLVANDEGTRSRVEAVDGGIVALVSDSRMSMRSVLRIAVDGSILIPPGMLRVGDEPVRNVAMASDPWGVTVIVASTTATAPLALSRYDWAGTRFYEHVLEDTRSGGTPLLLRSDRAGGVYLLALGGNVYQHYDAFGREGAFDRIISCPPLPERRETNLADRPEIDAGVDAALAPDAGAADGSAMADATTLDAGPVPSDAGAGLDDAP